MKGSTGRLNTTSRSNRLDNYKFDEERLEIISLLNELFIKNSISYSWEQNQRYGDLYYNVLKIASNYKLSDGSTATRNSIIKNNLQSKNPTVIYRSYVLIDAIKRTAIFSLVNNDESERAFKNWRFQILKADQ